MGTYRKEWDCCGSVTETQAWEPEECPFCTPVAPAEQPADVFSLMLHSKPRHEDSPGTVLLDEHFRVAPAEPAAQAVEQARLRDLLQVARGALADIAHSDDLTHAAAKRKAARVYAETDDTPAARDAARA